MDEDIGNIWIPQICHGCGNETTYNEDTDEEECKTCGTKEEALPYYE